MGEGHPDGAAQFQYTATMPYHHSVGSRGFAFADLRTLMARASPLRLTTLLICFSVRRT